MVVPLGPGEAKAPALLDQLCALPADCEVVVVHAGATPATAGRPGMRHLTSAPGRARQMNAGAAHARGAWLWFLHADSRLTFGCIPAMLAFARRRQPVLGWFPLAFRGDGPALTRLNAWGANVRSRWLGLPFGDQGLALPAIQFRALGGYDEAAPNGEDHLLVWAAHAARLKLVRLDAVLQTSARKYARHGWSRTTMRHWRATLLQAYTAWRRMRARRTAGVTEDGSGPKEV